MLGSSAPGKSLPPPPGNTHGSVLDFRHDVVKTHTIVSELRRNATDTHNIISDIHRTIVKGQGGSSSRNRPVRATHVSSTEINAHRFPDSDQVSDPSYG